MMKDECGVLFETPRLRVRIFRETDAPVLFMSHQDAAVQQWIPNESYRDLNEARGAITFFAGCVRQNHLPYVLAAELKDGGELIGDAGINEVEGKPGEVEIGYCICAEHRGKGYATELLDAMGRFIADQFGIHVLYARVMRGNEASVRVLEKNGYTFVLEEQDAQDDPYGRGMLVYRRQY